MIEWQ